MGAGPSSPSHDSSDTPILSATFDREFSIRAATDKEDIRINRMVTLPDDRICIVDYPRNYIKLFSDNFVLLDKIYIPSCYAVACVDENTIGVGISGFYESSIVCFSVRENKIKETERQIQIDGTLSDVAYRHDDFMCRYLKKDQDMTYYGSKCIIKRRVAYLHPADFMHYDPISDCVLQENYIDSSVTCYKPNGNVKWKVTTGGKPAGLIVAQGVVLVADGSDNVIRQITMDGRLLSTPLLTKEHGLVEPQTIAYQRKTHKLIIANKHGENAMVFKLVDSP